MYRKEDKELILADFYASGMNAAAFARLPGSPSDDLIRKWDKEAKQGLLDVPKKRIRGRCDHKKHARYPQATKREALSLLRKGMGYATIARRLGLTDPEIIRYWERTSRKKPKIAPKGASTMKEKPKTKVSEPTPSVHTDESGKIEQLERQLAEANLRLDALREMMCDPKAGYPESLSNAQKAVLGERLRKDFGYRLKDILTFLKISKSSYEYARKAIRRRALRNSQVEQRVYHAFTRANRVYGYRRIQVMIQCGLDGLEPMRVSEREVRQAMRAGHMVARRTRRKEHYNSYTGEVDNRPDNLPLCSDGTHVFRKPRPDELVVTDVTEFKVKGNEKVYLSPIIDCFDGCPRSWSISFRADSELVDSSLRAYLDSLPKDHSPVVVHTDGGGVYRSASWKSLCSKGGVIRSMSRKSCCGDNARAEGFFGILKEEFYNSRSWARTSAEDFIRQLDEYLNWYRDTRLKRFKEGRGQTYDTIVNHRKRYGYVA